MTEHEYEEWFDKNLGDVESLDNLYNNDSPFTYAPKPLKRGKWFILCAIGFAICLILSLCTAFIYETTSHWIWNWFSNLLLSFSIGLIASLSIMLYTNIRDKNIVFYSDIIPVIEKRVSSLRKAYSAYSLKIQREYQSQNYQNSYDAWHKNSNTCIVILGYIRFLNTVLPSNFVEALPKEEQLNKEEDRILSANNKIQKEFLNNGFFQKKPLKNV